MAEVLGPEALVVPIQLSVLEVVEVSRVPGVVPDHTVLWSATQSICALVFDRLLALTRRLES